MALPSGTNAASSTFVPAAERSSVPSSSDLIGRNAEETLGEIVRRALGHRLLSNLLQSQVHFTPFIGAFA